VGRRRHCRQRGESGAAYGKPAGAQSRRNPLGRCLAGVWGSWGPGRQYLGAAVCCKGSNICFIPRLLISF
jgi:hypothetical protein